MKAVKPVLSDVKIRASYGVNGNQPGSYYGYKGLYSYGENYMEAAGSYESAQPNDLLTWEKNYSLNLGMTFHLSIVFLRVWNITTGIPKTCFTVSPSAPLPDLPVI